MADLSVNEVAEIVGVKPDRVRAWIKSGRLGGYQIGREWRIPPEALDAIRGPARTGGSVLVIPGRAAPDSAGGNADGK